MPPVPKPKPDLQGNVKLNDGSKCALNGWCSGPNFSGPPLSVRVILDGTPIANVTASLHRKVAGDHGYQIPFDCAKIASGSHQLLTEAFYKGEWLQLAGSPMCFKGGKEVMCK
jgi:hypothetical protein